MRKLVLVLLACLFAFAAAADVSAEVEIGAATAVGADFEAEVQSAIASDESTEAEVAAEAEADEAEAETEVDAEAEATETEEAVESVAFLEVSENDLQELDEAEAEIDAVTESAATEEEADSESVEELAATVNEIEGQCNTMEEAMESSDAEFALVEQYDEVSQQAEAEEEAEPEMRMAQTEGVFSTLGKMAVGGAKLGAKVAVGGAKLAVKGAVGGAKLMVKGAKMVAKAGKAMVKAGVKVVKKIAKKVGQSKLLKHAKKIAKKAIKIVKKVVKKLLKKGAKLAKKAWKKGKKLAKKAWRKGKKLAKKAWRKGKKGAKALKKFLKKFGRKVKKLAKRVLRALCRMGVLGRLCRANRMCLRGRAGRRCRREKCRGHRAGCRYPCMRGGWSRRHRHKRAACRGRGGVMSDDHPNYPADMTDFQEQQLDIAQGVLTADGGVGPNAHGGPATPDMGSASNAVDDQGRPLFDPTTGRPYVPGAHTEGPVLYREPGSNDPYSGRDEEDRDGKGSRNMWNGVDPKYHGQADIPKVPRLPEDVEDCVACQYVWKQVEQDVGNSAITQTIYDSFHANAIDAQRTPVFYPAVQTMFDAADDMIGDYMEGFTVNQICENSMLCRPRDLSQFLKHQRVTKGI